MKNQTRAPLNGIIFYLALSVCLLTGIQALAQEETRRTIPVEIEEADAHVPRTYKAALGIAIDPFPVIMSGTYGEKAFMRLFKIFLAGRSQQKNQMACYRLEKQS